MIFVRLSALLAAIAAAAATPATIAQVPDDTVRTYPAAGFDRIEAGGCDRITVASGPAFAVSAEGDAASLDAIRAEVRGQTLYLERERRSCGSTEASPATIRVTLPHLRGVTSRGSGDIRTDAISTDRFEVILAGSGGLEVAGLRADAGTVRSSGTGDIVLRDIQAERLALDVAGTASIVATGRGGTLSLATSGTGAIDTRELSAREIAVDARGAGRVRARVEGDARIDASGTSAVAITGQPRCRIAKRGLATVSCG